MTRETVKRILELINETDKKMKNGLKKSEKNYKKGKYWRKQVHTFSRQHKKRPVEEAAATTISSINTKIYRVECSYFCTKKTEKEKSFFWKRKTLKF